MGLSAGPRPGLDRTFPGRLLFVGVAERHPVAVLLQHGVHVFDDAKVVVKDGFPAGADQHGWVGGFISIHLE
jgi:hypothetical protein